MQRRFLKVKGAPRFKDSDTGAYSWSGPQGNSEGGKADEDEGTRLAHLFRGQTAQAMWDEYQLVLHEGNYVDNKDIFPNGEMEDEDELEGPEDDTDAQ